MNIIIRTRSLIDSDLSRDCPIPETDIEEFKRRLKNMCEDLADHDVVTSAWIDSGNIRISTELNKEKLLDEIKPIFSSYFDSIRFVGADELD